MLGNVPSGAELAGEVGDELLENHHHSLGVGVSHDGDCCVGQTAMNLRLRQWFSAAE